MAKPTKSVKRSDSKAVSPAKPSRADGWENVLTGLGTYARDKRTRATIVNARLTREEAETMWANDFLVALIVEGPVEDMLRGGFSVNVSAVEEEEPEDVETREDDGPPAPGGFPPPEPKHVPGAIEVDETNKRMGDLIDAKHEDLRTLEVVGRALKEERALGGAAILIGAVDGTTDMALPLNEEALREVRFLTNFTAQDCLPAAYYGDPREPRYGEPSIYRLQPLTMPSGYAPGVRPNAPVGAIFVHESRLLIFPGLQTTRREALVRNGWGQSVIERVFEAVRDYRTGMQGASALIADFAQAVLKVKGLADIFQSNDQDALRNRFAGMDLARSMLRMLVVDSDEEFERKSTPVTGLAELLDRHGTQVAAASRIPVTRLFGQAPAGLNATGASDIRAYYDAIESERASKVRRVLERLTRLILLSNDGPTKGVEPATWSVQFPPLWQPTAKERAEERKIVAETDAIYLKEGVVTPEEVAASRYGGDEWSPETVLDIEGRRLVAEADEAAVEEAAEQEPPVPEKPPTEPVVP